MSFFKVIRILKEENPRDVTLWHGVENIWIFRAFLEVKFMYSEKATKYCEISLLLLTVCSVVKSKGKISQNFVAFSEYMNFTEKMQAIA